MNLIELALAAEAYYQRQPVIQQTTAQCVRTKNMHASCDRCADLCPTGAIRLDTGLPELAPEQCVKCGICLHGCPMGVFERADDFQRLLSNSQNLREHQIIDIACLRHPAPQTTAPSVDSVLQTGNCLAELGVSAFVGLLAFGVEQVRVRLDACAACPLRVLYPSIEHCIAATRQLLSVMDLSNAVIPVHAREPDWADRPLHQNQNSRMSRRGLFSSLLNPEAAARQASNLIDEADASDPLPRERRRLLRVLYMLTEPVSDIPEEVRLYGAGFVQLVTTSACNACGLCERVCPTNAMKVTRTDDQFIVVFEPHRCLDCQLCIDYCEPQALRKDGAPSLRHVFDEARLQLYAGQMQQCSRCKAHFAGSPNELLCPVCSFRRENPNGIRLPDALLAQLSPVTRKRLAAVSANDSNHQ